MAKKDEYGLHELLKKILVSTALRAIRKQSSGVFLMARIHLL